MQQGTQTSLASSISDPPVSEQEEIQREIAQLKRTLDVRAAEIALATERTKTIEEKNATIRAASLQMTAKHREVQDLQKQLADREALNKALRGDIQDARRRIVAINDERQRIRDKRQHIAAAMRPIVNDIMEFSRKKANEERKSKPVVTVAALHGLSNFAVDEHEEAIGQHKACVEESAAATARLREVHSACLEEVNAAAAEKQLQKEQLDDAWEREKARLEQELRLVTARAHEAAYHQRRGTGHADPNQGQPGAGREHLPELRKDVNTLRQNIRRYVDGPDSGQ